MSSKTFTEVIQRGVNTSMRLTWEISKHKIYIELYVKPIKSCSKEKSGDSRVPLTWERRRPRLRSKN